MTSGHREKGMGQSNILTKMSRKMFEPFLVL